MRDHQQIPIIELEGLNVDEKETRHDIDKRVSKDIDIKNRSSEKLRKIPE